MSCYKLTACSLYTHGDSTGCDDDDDDDVTEADTTMDIVYEDELDED